MGHLTKTANDIVSAVEKFDHVKELLNGKLVLEYGPRPYTLLPRKSGSGQTALLTSY